jgi:hypothetical protein
MGEDGRVQTANLKCRRLVAYAVWIEPVSAPIIPCYGGINRDFSRDSALPVIFDYDCLCEFSCLHENSLRKEQGIFSNEQGILAGEQGFPFRYGNTVSTGDPVLASSRRWVGRTFAAGRVRSRLFVGHRVMITRRASTSRRLSPLY